jgi:SAM-dependent methyltransferase
VLERQSIRDFVRSQSEFLKGRVLDVGCGQQPYRDIVEDAGGTYVGYDRPGFPGAVVTEPVGNEPFQHRWDAVLMTQVLQYVPTPLSLLRRVCRALNPGGAFVLTYATCWDEVESADMWRFTRSGMDEMIRRAGMHVVVHERRAEIELGGFRFPLGGGLVARP